LGGDVRLLPIGLVEVHQVPTSLVAVALTGHAAAHLRSVVVHQYCVSYPRV
jgi:hypothetical protein